MFSIHKLNVRKAKEGENSMNLENDIPDYAMIPAKQYEEKTLIYLVVLCCDGSCACT